MSRVFRDSWDGAQHQNLKRSDRIAQRSAWKRRGREEAAAPLPCPWRAPGSETVEFHAAHVLALFEGDLALVRFSGKKMEDVGVRVLRGGIPWERWFPVLLSAYRQGLPVPPPFVPSRRLPADWIEKALEWNAADQGKFFARLRETGLLPPLEKIRSEGVSPWLRWDEVRGRFLDFK